MTLEVSAPVRVANDYCLTPVVRRIEGTDGENKFVGTVLVWFFAFDLEGPFGQQLAQLGRVPLAAMFRLSAWRFTRQLLQLLSRNRRPLSRNVKELRSAVRSFFGVVALTGHRAVDFRDSRGIEGVAVDVDFVVAETLRQHLQHSPHQLLSRV